MKDVEVLADLITSISERTRSIVTGLSRAELAWRPDAQGNSIGVTVWHYSRWLDLLVIRLLKNKPAEEEQWHTQGWMTRTGYDPRGIGFGGLGAITGYTQKEVSVLPEMSAEELLAYLDQGCNVLHQHLLTMPEGSLEKPALGQTKRTIYQLVQGILMGSIEHIGEIEALKALQVRAQQETSE